MPITWLLRNVYIEKIRSVVQLTTTSQKKGTGFIYICIYIIISNKLILTTFREIHSENVNRITGQISYPGLVFLSTILKHYLHGHKLSPFSRWLYCKLCMTLQVALCLYDSVDTTKPDWDPIWMKSVAGFLIDFGEIFLSLRNKVSSFESRFLRSVYVVPDEFVYSRSESSCCHTHTPHPRSRNILLEWHYFTERIQQNAKGCPWIPY